MSLYLLPRCELWQALAKDDDWRLLSVHTQTGTAKGFAKVSCFENLLGSPTFVDIRKGRLRCVETGHEVVVGEKKTYARNKRCRLGLIDHPLSHGKSPLTKFSQCLISRSKLVCKLIGDTVNKNEEHIWKYVNGKRYLHRLEQVERGAVTSGKTEKIQVTNKHRRVKEETDSNDSEFWMLKSSSGSESEQESDEENCKGSHCDAKEYEEPSERTKRMSIEIGPSMIITAATMIMRLKATIQSLEGRMSSHIEKRAKYAQLPRKCSRVFTALVFVSLLSYFRTLSYRGSSRRESMLWLLSSPITVFTMSCVFDNIVANSLWLTPSLSTPRLPEKVVFHLVTNAMKSWFAMNMDNLKGVTVEVQV
ncbi:hypothetical protein Bca52824_039281 [Brassica carinata]|uniref:Uncharacterized protein n=1 Tax=Brassica carinata TaxID=52824 RepID=A0A8X7RR83_BRACI|nr:hypothetical protein Bca52824_039281 [Brassica carinata]